MLFRLRCRKKIREHKEVNKEKDTRRISANTDRDEWLEIIMNNYGEKLTKLAFNYLKDWGKAEDL